jgi:mannosyltransferase OCH1-like enzyme
MSIPKITHQIWMQGWDALPEKFKQNVDDLHTMNPEYEHKQWDEKSLREECKKVGNSCVARFDSYEKMISKVDFGRYVLLYRYGGISIDTDMKPLRPIRETPGIDKTDFMISEATFPYNLIGGLNNAVILCRPEHPYMKKILDAGIKDTRKQSDFVLKDMYVHYTTGPLFVMEQLGGHRKELVILPYKYYEPCLSLDKYCKVDSQSIMDHKHELSWMTGFLKYIIHILCFIKHYFLYIMAAILSAIVLLRSLRKRKSQTRRRS